MNGDCGVKAWNFVDEAGHPIYEIDEEMTFAEYMDKVAGKYAAVTCGLLRPVTREAIDAALGESQ